MKKKEIRHHFYSFTGQTMLQKIYVRYYRRGNKFGRLVASRIAKFHIVFRFDCGVKSGMSAQPHSHDPLGQCPVSRKTPVPAPWIEPWLKIRFDRDIMKLRHWYPHVLTQR